MAVNALGQLALTSTGVDDFDLQKPEGGFKKLKWPMFKPNLMQICNSGYRAFQEAHLKMDAIRQNTLRIPGGMKEIVTILVKGDKTTMETVLPIALGNVRSIADECLASAKVHMH